MKPWKIPRKQLDSDIAHAQRRTLNIEKAKEILELDLKENGQNKPPDLKEAQALGVQALQRIYDVRHKIGVYYIDTLPGEDE